MTPQQKKVYDLCAADHDRLRSRKTTDSRGVQRSTGGNLDAFSRYYNLGYEKPNVQAGQHPRPDPSSLADAAWRAGRDRRKAEERETNRKIRTARRGTWETAL